MQFFDTIFHFSHFFSISYSTQCLTASFPFSLSFHSMSLFSSLPLSLPDSLLSVCLCARGAVCYLDDLVCEGERDFISCLPEGLCYPWWNKTALLKKRKESSIQLRRIAEEQQVKVHSLHSQPLDLVCKVEYAPYLQVYGNIFFIIF